MDPVIATLLDLDRLEMDRLASERAVGELPARIADLSLKLDKRKAWVAQVTHEIEDREQKLFAASHQVIARNAEINRLQESMASQSSNREYDSLHTAILNQQEALQSLYPLQQNLRTELVTLRERLQESTGDEGDVHKASLQLASWQQKLAESAQEQEHFRALCVQKLANLPRALAKEWEQLAAARARKNTSVQIRPLVLAMAAGDKSCHNCFTELTRQTLKDLARPDSLLNCPACGAYLFTQNPSEVRLA